MQVAASLLLIAASLASQIPLPETLGVITGRVLDEQGRPVSGASVQYLRWTLVNGQRVLMPQGSAIANQQGDYRATGLVPGRYLLEAQSSPSGPLIEPGSREVSDPGQPIEITSSLTFQAADVRLRKASTFRISGHVTGVTAASADTLERRIVTLSSRNAARRGGRTQVYASPEGDFRIEEVLPGSYILSSVEFGPGQERRSARINLDIRDHDMNGLSLNLQPGPVLKGKLQGAPAFASILVSLEQLGIAPLTAAYGRPDAQGRLLIRYADAELYRVHVSGIAAGYYVKRVELGRLDAKEVLDLTKPIQDELVITLEKGTADLFGEVFHQNRRPAKDATVLLFHPRGDLLRHAITDGNGRFAIPEIPPGDYRIVAAAAVHLSDPVLLDRLATTAEKITLARSAKETRRLEVR